MPKPPRSQFESLDRLDASLHSYLSAILGGTIQRTDPSQPLPKVWRLPSGEASAELQTSHAQLTLLSGTNPETSEEWVSAVLVLDGNHDYVFEGETFLYRLNGGSMMLSRAHMSPTCSTVIEPELQPLNWDASAFILLDGQIDQAKLNAYIQRDATEREALDLTAMGGVETATYDALAEAAQCYGFATPDEFADTTTPTPLWLTSRLDG